MIWCRINLIGPDETTTIMPLIIPDNVLKQALTEADGRIEIACQFFAAGKLSKSAVTHWLGLARTEVEEELLKRELPLTVYTPAHLKQDLNALNG
jgi:predicted HTH domain antitoxin